MSFHDLFAETNRKVFETRQAARTMQAASATSKFANKRTRGFVLRIGRHVWESPNRKRWRKFLIGKAAAEIEYAIACRDYKDVVFSAAAHCFTVADRTRKERLSALVATLGTKGGGCRPVGQE